MSEELVKEERTQEDLAKEELVKSVQGMLNEEKWTRAAISNYSKTNFVDLAAIVEKAKAGDCVDEVKAVCDEHLQHTKNSIIALYISGILALKKGALDNGALDSLVSIFQDNRKGNIVVYLCETILAEDGANKFALRTLAGCYRDEGNDKVWDIYEQLVKLDHEDAETARLLAERCEKNGERQDAIDYYKKAIFRYINQRMLNQVKDIWTKLIALIPEELDFFYHVQRKIAKGISEDKSALMMQDLYQQYYKKNKRWDAAIGILKLILEIDEKDSWARKELIECYKGKFANHSQLEECIRVSNLSQGWRNVFEAISDFEKHIAFDAKNYVFHRSWGVGIILKVENDQIKINFGKKNGVREMSLKMAVNALYPLARDHIWVLKATKSREELAAKIKDDKTWALKTIIKSFDNNCDFKRIKGELVPSILTPSEWTSWSSAARKILDSDSSFGVNPNDINLYSVRDHEVSPEEKLANEFKAQKQFFARIDILMRFIDEADTSSEMFTDMVTYFVQYLKSYSAVTEYVMASFLVLKRIREDETINLTPEIPCTFAELFEHVENPREMYLSLKDTKNTFLRPDFLTYVKALPNWVEIYIELFPSVLRNDMIVTLVNDGHADRVRDLALQCFDNFRDYREADIYFFKECQDEPWFKEADIPYEKQLITMIHVLEITFREIANHLETTENRKLNRQVQILLFKNDALLKYILQHDEDTITRLYTLVDDIKDLDPAIKMNMRNRILEKFPDFKFYGAEEKTAAPQGLIVTARMYDAKKQQLEHITNVEIPENSREVGEALALGDLRENAEYKAAKERQGQLSTMAGKLQDEINRAQIFDPTTITTVRVSFGTTVTLENRDTGKTEEYTILGPWESDPDNKIISYMSPFGNAILNSKEGDDLNFVINERKCAYKVRRIAAAKL
ncbi:MAG: transcription elongation factor GreA [Spirochaetaceae bacterium]|jgi:transcription elongation factor GreA|nr:transcription elongation factor GreA [Spirochaetaceae bacterium]